MTAALLAVLLAAAAPPAGATRQSPAFEEAVQDAFREIFIPFNGWKDRGSLPRSIDLDPRTGLMEVSDRVFALSPQAESELRHLRDTVGSQTLSGGEWTEFREFQDSLGGTLQRRGIYFSPGLKRRVYLVGAAILWHQAQHRYDQTARESSIGEALDASDSVEGEMRSWRAGCLLWRAGLAGTLHPDTIRRGDPFRCDEGFPKAYYCKLYTAAELVVLSAIAARTGSAEERAETSQELAAYCWDLERIDGGNALAVAGFSPRWDSPECQRRAVRAVLAPGWKSSLEECPAEQKIGPDVRAAARALIGETAR